MAFAVSLRANHLVLSARLRSMRNSDLTTKITQDTKGSDD